MRQFERLLDPSNHAFNRAIFMECPSEDGCLEVGKSLIEIADINSVHLIMFDCNSLIDCSHVYPQLVKFLLDIPLAPTTAPIKTTTKCPTEDELHSLSLPRPFLEFYQRTLLPLLEGKTVFIVFSGCERLLKEDESLLWNLLHLQGTNPSIKHPLRFILLSSGVPVMKFASTFEGVPIHLLPPLSIKPSPTSLINEAATYFESRLPAKIAVAAQPKTLKILLQHTYSLFKDLIPDTKALSSFFRVIFPLYLKESQKQSIPLTNIPLLYKANIEAINRILSGEFYRRRLIDEGRCFSRLEKYLLISAYLAAHNHSRFDLRLFSNTYMNKKNRIKNNAIGGGGGVPHYHKVRAHQLQNMLRSHPRPFQQDRLIAIFYYITESPAPPMSKVFYTINDLFSRSFLLPPTTSVSFAKNSTSLHPRYKCPLSIDQVMCWSKEVGFNISRYLSLNLI